MESKEILTELFNEANRLSFEEPKYATHDLWEMYKQIQNDLEVLEIIRNKSVDIGYIRLCMDVNDGLHKMYNYSITNPNDELTQEEYNKIKEWLKDERISKDK